MLSTVSRLLPAIVRAGSSLAVASVEGGVGTPDFQAQYCREFINHAVAREDPTVSRLRDGILAGERASLAAGITLVESSHLTKRAQGNALLQEILKEEKRRFEQSGPDSLKFRVAISGSPGVGKSSFIEALGEELTEKRGMRVAVLTVDPSSRVTGGSLLGDLTRMKKLAVNPRAYIRQSPSCGVLGGVTRGIHESIILCEAAGHDVVIIETVGVGQSETSVVDMCDMLTLLLSPAHGDELQGVKRGIVEVSDLLVVTKDDGDLKAKAKMAQAQYTSALTFMRPRSPEWNPRVLRSSITDAPSVSAVWDRMEEYRKTMKESGTLMRRRNEQMNKCMWSHVDGQLASLFMRHPRLREATKEMERRVSNSEMTPGQAADSLIAMLTVQ